MWWFTLTSTFGIVSLAFIVWMLVYCLQSDPDRYVWAWVILIFGPIGAAIYFFVRYLPTHSISIPRFFGRFYRSKRLRQLEWKCRQIGNAHQWVEYADALRDSGRWDEADESYQNAVERDPESLPARWGLATTSFHSERDDVAQEHLEFVLGKDPRYKFGDPSLMLAKVLLRTGQKERAEATLSDHVIAHRTPEAVYLLGQLQLEDGSLETARDTLQGLVDDLENAPRAIVRKSMFWRSRAKRLLRKIR